MVTAQGQSSAMISGLFELLGEICRHSAVSLTRITVNYFLSTVPVMK